MPRVGIREKVFMPRRAFTAGEDKSILDYAKALYLEHPHTDPERQAVRTEACRSDLKHLNRQADVVRKRFDKHLRREFNKWQNAQRSEHFTEGDGGAGADHLVDVDMGGPPEIKAELEVDDAAGFRRSPGLPAVQDADEVRRVVSFAAREEAPDIPRADYGLHLRTAATTLEEANGIEGRDNRPRRCLFSEEEGHSIGRCPDRRELSAMLLTLRELNSALPKLRELRALLPRLREFNALLPTLRAVFPDVS